MKGWKVYKGTENLGFCHHEIEVSEHKLGGGSTMGRTKIRKQSKGELTTGQEGQISVDGPNGKGK